MSTQFYLIYTSGGASYGAPPSRGRECREYDALLRSVIMASLNAGTRNTGTGAIGP